MFISHIFFRNLNFANIFVLIQNQKFLDFNLNNFGKIFFVHFRIFLLIYLKRKLFGFFSNKVLKFFLILLRIFFSNFSYLFFFSDPPVTCDFKTQKVWIFIWLAMNVLALIGLLVSIGLFADLGWWSMTHEPLHVGVFFMILLLLILLIYGHLIVVTVYLVLKDAWIRGILGNNVNDDEDMAGLTHGGKRIYA